MRRRAIPGDGDVTMSLLPFLAVLICTMGALIILLVVVVQQARVQATPAVVESDNGTIVDMRAAQAAIESLSLERLRLIDARQSLQTELATRETRQQELASRIALLSRRLRESQDAQMQADLDAAAAIEERAQAEWLASNTQRELDWARESLERQKSELDRKKPKYALLPYHGPNETSRRPIYIECLADRVVIQPEGITLTAEDFDGAANANNPLVSALNTVRDHWLKTRQVTANDLPYPLLVVRPEGAESYAAARISMRHWESDFGYELVSNDIELAYPGRGPAADGANRGGGSRRHVADKTPEWLSRRGVDLVRQRTHSRYLRVKAVSSPWDRTGMATTRVQPPSVLRVTRGFRGKVVLATALEEPPSVPFLGPRSQGYRPFPMFHPGTLRGMAGT